MASNFQGAGAPPPGVEPNFVDPVSLYPEILATIVLCIILPTIFTFVRLYAKRSFSRFTLDDCKYSTILTIRCSCASYLDILILAWVSDH